MQMTTEIFGNVIVVHSPEELGGDQAEEITRYLSNVHPEQLVLDLDGTEMIDSRGLVALLDVQESLRADGGNLKLATNNAVNRKILELTRIDRRIELYDSVIDAVKSYR